MALPQPRSSRALAAETRAAGVAFSLRMILARTVIAVRVWLRASERISVSGFVFDILRFAMFAGRLDGLRGAIMRDRAERNGWKIRLLGSVPGVWDQLGDVGAHEGSSHSAIATRPTSASEIRYAVIGFSPEIKYAA
jgi:hypothetical protein